MSSEVRSDRNLAVVADTNTIQPSDETTAGLYWYCPQCGLGNTLFESECYACKRVQKLDEISPILKKLCLSSVAEWSDLRSSDLEIDFLIGGQSNRLFTVTVMEEEDDDNSDDCYHHSSTINKDNHHYSSDTIIHSCESHALNQIVTHQTATATKPSRNPRNHGSSKGVIRLFNPRMPLSKDQLQCVFDAFQESGLGTNILGSFQCGFGHVENFIQGHRVSDLDLLNDKSDSLCMARHFSCIHQFDIDRKHFDITMDDRIYSLIERVVCFLSQKTKKNKTQTIQSDCTRDHWLWHLGKELRPSSWQSSVFDASMVDGGSFNDLNRLLIGIWDKIKSSLNEACMETVKRYHHNNQIYPEMITDGISTTSNSNSNSNRYSLVLGNEEVFCHCDLHSGNVIRMESDSTDFKVIDYEYARFAPRVFDLGNHFNEYFFDNFYEESPFFKLREERRPCDQFVNDFLTEYVRNVIDLRKKKKVQNIGDDHNNLVSPQNNKNEDDDCTVDTDPDSSAEGYSVELDPSDTMITMDTTDSNNNNHHRTDDNMNKLDNITSNISNRDSSVMTASRMKENAIRASVEGLKTTLLWGQVMSGFHWTLWSILESDRTDVEWGYAEYGQCRYMEVWRVINGLSKDHVHLPSHHLVQSEM